MQQRARLRRAIVAFAIGLLVVLPVSAAAAPATVDATVQGNDNNNDGDRGGNDGDRGNSGNAPGQSDDGPGKSEDAPGQSDDGPGNSESAPGRSDVPQDGSPGRSVLAPGHLDGPAPGLAARPTPGVPPGLARDVGAAFVMLELPDDQEVVVLVTPAEPDGLSGELVSVLSPVMPPAFVEVVTSPIVIFEALLEAMASSGQALVIPFIAAGIGFFLPGLRRRDVLAAVIADD